MILHFLQNILYFVFYELLVIFIDRVEFSFILQLMTSVTISAMLSDYIILLKILISINVFISVSIWCWKVRSQEMNGRDSGSLKLPECHFTHSSSDTTSFIQQGYIVLFYVGEHFYLSNNDLFFGYTRDTFIYPTSLYCLVICETCSFIQQGLIVGLHVRQHIHLSNKA